MGKPKSLLLKDVGAAARYLASTGSYIDELELDESPVDKGAAEAIRDHSAEGLKALTEALEAGADPEETVTFPGVADDGSEIEEEITLGALQPFLEDTLRKADGRVLWLNMEQRAMSCHSYAEDGDDLNPDLASIAVDYAKDLVTLVGRAKDAGIDPDRKMEFWGNSYSLDELKELGTYLGETAEKIMGTLDEAKKAADEPYLSALKGDRKKVFEAEFAGMGGMWQCLGAGKAALDTPELLAGSDVWYVFGNSSTPLLDVWRLRGWRFSGDDITEHLASTGVGLTPPEAAFEA